MELKIKSVEGFSGVEANVLGCDIVVSKFEF